LFGIDDEETTERDTFFFNMDTIRLGDLVGRISNKGDA
jgi:hypothetical protein